MMSRSLLAAGLALSLTVPLSGCLAAKVVTLPVKVVGAGIDAVTTSQAEADQKRGREARQAEERAAKARRKCERAHPDERWRC